MARLRGFEPVSEEGLKKALKMRDKFREKGFRKVYINKEYKEPIRATRYSAGSDVFYTGDETIMIEPKEKVFVITNVKAYMQENEMLIADVRSSQGVFKDLMLCNTIGIIDMDYYNNDGNEGNIGIALKNMGTETVYINKGEAIAQLIFVPYLVPDNEPLNKDRKDGFGHTTNK